MKLTRAQENALKGLSETYWRDSLCLKARINSLNVLVNKELARKSSDYNSLDGWLFFFKLTPLGAEVKAGLVNDD